MSKTVALIPGFTEGKWHTKRFKRALVRRGYHFVLQADHADIVIAHSGGCYEIPALRPNTYIDLIETRLPR